MATDTILSNARKTIVMSLRELLAPTKSNRRKETVPHPQMLSFCIDEICKKKEKKRKKAGGLKDFEEEKIMRVQAQ